MSKQYAEIILNPNSKNNVVSNFTVSGGLINYHTPAATRGIDMLLAKYYGKPFQSEVRIMPNETFPVARLSKKLNEAKIAFVTDGGLVPIGNPDNLEPVGADKFCIYSFGGMDTLLPNQYEVSHQGYDNKYVIEDPNRLLPLDAARKAQKEGIIGKVSDIFYTTAGVMVGVKQCQIFGRKIAISLRESDVDGVILTSTCGTSTRCGAYIACEIEKLMIPVVQVTNLTQISEGIGCSRILKGHNVSHVFGNPNLLPHLEKEWRYRLFCKALELLAYIPESNSCIVSELDSKF